MNSASSAAEPSLLRRRLIPSELSSELSSSENPEVLSELSEEEEWRARFLAGLPLPGGRPRLLAGCSGEDLAGGWLGLGIWKDADAWVGAAAGSIAADPEHAAQAFAQACKIADAP